MVLALFTCKHECQGVGVVVAAAVVALKSRLVKMYVPRIRKDHCGWGVLQSN